jgi:alcohol dehydrogenase, propanol-preferring
MLAVRLFGPGEPLRLKEVPVPSLAQGGVLIRVAGCGVCHTDLHIVDGRQTRVELPRTLGHEVAGWIESGAPESEAGLAQRGLAVGDPVLVFGGWGCGACRECASGAEQRCATSRAPGFQEDGGYAELMRVPDARHLVPLGRLDPVRAAPLADAGVTPYRAVQRVLPWLHAGSRVLLIGCGALGRFTLQYLRLVPEAGDELHVTVRELDPARLEQAAALGTDVGLLDGDAAMTLEAMGGPADVVFDLVGKDETLALATSVVTPGGVVMLVGEGGGAVRFAFESAAIEAWLTNVAWGSRADLYAVVRLARRGRLHWDVEAVPLREAASAHDRLRAGESGARLVLVP